MHKSEVKENLLKIKRGEETIYKDIFIYEIGKLPNPYKKILVEFYINNGQANALARVNYKSRTQYFQALSESVTALEIALVKRGL